MKIIYITDQLLPRTATDTKQMVSMASALGSAGASVTLVVPRRWFSLAQETSEIASYYEVASSFSIEPVRSLYPGIRGIEKLAQGVVGPLQKVCRDCDVIYTRTLPILAGALLWGSGPVVYETYRPWPTQKPASSSIFRWAGSRSGFLGAVLHSKLAAQSYAGVGVPEKKLLTAYNGYDPDRLLPRLSIPEARSICGLVGDSPLVTYAGRMNRSKGLGLVLQMAARMKDVRFVLVGSETQGTIERQASALPNVTVVNWKPFSQIVPYLYAADVLLIPPTKRPLERIGNTVLPIKTFQYLGTGRAIFAPDTPDLRELLEDGRNAALTTPDDLDAAVSRLSRLLGDEGERDRLGMVARTTVADLTWDNRATRVLEFISRRLDEERL